MSFIKIALGDAHEPQTAPEGEYDVRCIKSTLGESKAGKPMWTLMFQILGEGAYIPVRVNVMLETPGQSKEQAKWRALEVKRMCHALNVGYESDGLKFEDFIGAEGRVLLKIEHNDQGGFGKQNKIVWPSLRE